MPDLKAALRNAHNAGDEEAARRIAEMIRTEPSFLDKAAGVGEAALTMVSGIIAEPAGGIAGAASSMIPGAPKGVGEGVSEMVSESLTYNPRTEEGRKNIESIGGSDVVQAISNALGGAEKYLGDAGYDLAGPLAGTLGAVIPTAIIEALGLGAPSKVAKGLDKLADVTEAKGAGIAADIDALKAPTPEAGLTQVAEGLQTGKPEDIGSIVQPDQAFYDAADEMGITVEPLASFASQNPQFRAVEMGLSSVPASQLDAQAKAFVGELSQKADDLITEYGGSLDKGEISDRFRAESLNTIQELALETDSLYDTLAMKIPAQAKVNAPETVSFIKQKAYDLGGRKELPPLLNKVLRQLETTEKATPSGRRNTATGKEIPGETVTKQPTHERLNQTRKEIGQALNSRSGPFKDQETGMLKALYKRLRSDQDAAAEGMGVADISQAANGLVKQRKHLEDNLSKLLGKDLERSISPVVGQSLKGLAKGNVDKWDSVMSKIPDKMRSEVVVSALNDVFRGSGLDGQSLSPVMFTKFMNDLDRSPAIKKRLYKELPEGSVKALENLRTVSKGVSTAYQDRIPTGRIAALFDDNDGLLRRLMGKGVMVAMAAKAGPIGAIAASEFINQSSNGAKAASSVLASPQFQNMVRTAVRDGFTEGAAITEKTKKMEKAFDQSAAFKKWSKALTKDERSKLASVGTLTYLLRDRNEEGEK
jgi:hypothetical protein